MMVLRAPSGTAAVAVLEESDSFSAFFASQPGFKSSYVFVKKIYNGSELFRPSFCVTCGLNGGTELPQLFLGYYHLFGRGTSSFEKKLCVKLRAYI